MNRYVLAQLMIGSITAWVGAAETNVPEGYRLVWSEDFSGANSLQRFVFSSPDHWKRVQVGDRFALEHENAGPKGYQPPHRSPHNIALIADHRFGSFVLDFEVQQTGREYGHRDACIFFGFIDPANYYYTHIATKSDPHAHQVFIVDDKPRTSITQKGTSGFDWSQPDKWHEVRLVRDIDSGKIQVFVDDLTVPIMTASDTSFKEGFIGLGSFDDTGRVTNIRVYARNADESRPGFFRAK
jgi:hypothetical protein